MPPRGVKQGSKRERQYDHIKDSQRERGVPLERAEEIAARTVNKERARSGESESSMRQPRNTRDSNWLQTSCKHHAGFRPGILLIETRLMPRTSSKARRSDAGHTWLDPAGS